MGGTLVDHLNQAPQYNPLDLPVATTRIRRGIRRFGAMAGFEGHLRTPTRLAVLTDF